MQTVRFSLLHKALISVAVLLTPVVIFSAYSYHRDVEHHKEDAIKDLTGNAYIYEGLMYQYLEKVKQRAVDFANDGVVLEQMKRLNSGDKGAAVRLAAHLRQNKMPLGLSINDIEVLSLSGRVVASASGANIGAVRSGEDFFAMAVKGIPAADDVGPGSDHQFLAAAAPIINSKGERLGVLVNYMHFSSLGKMFDNVLSGTYEYDAEVVPWVTRPYETFVYLVNDEKRIIAKSFGVQGVQLNSPVNILPVNKCLASKEEFTGFYLNYMETEVVGASICLPEINSVLIVEKPLAGIWGPLNEMRRNAMITALLLAGIIVALLIIFLRGVVRRLKVMSSLAEALAGGNYDVRVPVGPGDEIGALSGALNTMAEEIRGRTQSLTMSEERLRAVIDNSASAISLKDASGRYVMSNGKFDLLAAAARTGAAGKTDYDLFPPSVAMLFKMNDQKALDLRMPVHFEFSIGQGGNMRYYLSTTVPLLDAAKSPYAVCAIFTDVTDYKRVEEELRKNEARLKEAHRIAHLGNWDLDAQSGSLWWSEEVYRIFGITAGEFGGDWRAFLERVHPDDREAVKKAVDEALKDGKHFNVEHRILMPGGVNRVAAVQGEAVYDAQGAPIRMIGTVQDITERRRMAQEILKAQKLESVGLLAGGIAHEFNNVLTAILGNISLAKTFLKPGDVVLDRLVDAEYASYRARDLAGRLLIFSRGGAPVKKVMPVDKLIKDSAAIALAGTGVACDIACEAGLMPVEADEAQISQVVYNLIVNAVEAMGSGGRVRIRCLNAAETAAEGLAGHGKSVKITVEDDGPGISDEHISKIFDPFFTTKHKRSGLGLTAAYSIVKSHGGRITASSPPGGGAVFCVYLPAFEPEFGFEDADEVAITPQGRRRVLIMDDEEIVRTAAVEMAGHVGYEAEPAVNGEEAVEKYLSAKALGKPFDAVILDLTVAGGMGGGEAVKRISDADPLVKAIVSSGYSNDPVMSDFRSHGFSAVLLKPYSFAKLREVLKEAVGQ